MTRAEVGALLGGIFLGYCLVMVAYMILETL